MHTHHGLISEFAPVFALGFLLVIALFIAAFGAIARNWLSILAAFGIMGLILVFGKAAFEAEGALTLANGLGRAGAGIGEGVVKSAPWIAGASAVFFIGVLANNLAGKISHSAFTILGVSAIIAGAVGAVLLWGQTANLIILAALATVISLIGLCAWLSVVLSRHDMAKMEMMARFNNHELLPRQSQSAQLPPPQKLIEVKSNLPAVRRQPWRT